MTTLTLSSLLATAMTATLLGTAHASADPVEEVQISYAQTVNGQLDIGTMTAHSERQAQQMIADKREESGVIAAQVDHRVSVMGLDPLLPQQYGLKMLRAPQTWAYPDARGTIVAVIDSGVDGTHPDLAGRVMQGAEFLRGGDPRSTGNGWTSPHFHGTAVAGIIGATVNNGTGMAGLARGVRILPVRVLDASGGGYGSDVATGIKWAVDHGARVINLSLGGPQVDAVQRAAIDYALSKNVVLVAAAGNQGDSGNPVIYPAAYPGVIAVGAYGSDARAAAFSERAPYVSLSAPGVGITATAPGAHYVAGTGTSFAAPFVAATAALVRGNAPLMSAAGVRALLTRTATDLGPAGRDNSYGYGSVNPMAALSAIARPTPAKAQLAAPQACVAGARVRMTAAITWHPSATRAVLQSFVRGGWRTVAAAPTSWYGKASFDVVLPAAGRAVKYRTVASGVGSAVRTVALRPAARRTVSVSAPAMVSTDQAPVTLRVGGGRTISGVHVSLDYRAPGAAAWATLGSWPTGDNGATLVQVTLPAHGAWTFRARAEGTTSGSVAVRH